MTETTFTQLLVEMGFNPAIGVLVVTILIQFGGIVWFAAMLKGSLDGQKDITKELKKVVVSLHEFTRVLDRRVAILEDRDDRAIVLNHFDSPMEYRKDDPKNHRD